MPWSLQLGVENETWKGVGVELEGRTEGEEEERVVS